MTLEKIELARANMVYQQIRIWDVFDDTVLEKMSAIPREDFVPTDYRQLAFGDFEIPIGYGQVMMNPKIEARLLQAVQIKSSDSVLEIGTGSGYFTALLASLARHVVTVEISAELKELAVAKFKSHGIINIQSELGDGSAGWDKNGGYDVIILTGSIPRLEHQFRELLNIGGRLIVIVGDAPAMSVQLIHCRGKNQWSSETLFETVLSPLTNASQPDRFVF